MSPHSSLSAACLAACLCLGAAAANTILYEDWSGGCAPNANFDTPILQWGGSINGGVVPGNVACVQDPDLGKTVLQLTAHGDAFTGSGPTGVMHNLSPRGPSDEFTGWKNPGYAPSCAPHCDVRRVGGGIRSRIGFTGGSIEAHIKPCPQFGAASAMFTYNYTEVNCGSYLKPNIQNSCPQDYAEHCCLPDRQGGPPDCTINPNGKTGDVCRGTWVQNKEIDFEIPSSLQTGPGSVDPSLIKFTNTRMNSVTAFPWEYTFHTLAGVDPPYESDNFVDVGFAQNDGKYHKYRVDWVASDSAKFYVDDVLHKTVTGSKLVPDFGHLIMSTWFPNAWAGSPTFDTCQMYVDYIKVTSL